MTHDYKRHGTTTLFAALNAHDGTVIADCKTWHRHEEWLAFYNENPKPFVWTAKANDILQKVMRGRTALKMVQTG
jgi:hypothetical protein